MVEQQVSDSVNCTVKLSPRSFGDAGPEPLSETTVLTCRSTRGTLQCVVCISEEDGLLVWFFYSWVAGSTSLDTRHSDAMILSLQEQVSVSCKKLHL